jgi:hypothetical protein
MRYQVILHCSVPIGVDSPEEALEDVINNALEQFTSECGISIWPEVIRVIPMYKEDGE